MGSLMGDEVAEVKEIGGAETVETLTPNNIEYLQSIENLQPDAWKHLSVEGRVDTLRLLETRCAEIQGRPPVPVVMEKMDDCGFFDGEKLHINIDHVEDVSKRMEVIGTVAHEGRHAYQLYAMTHEGFHPNAKEVAYWRGNELAYFSPDDVGKKFGLEYYLTQPQELDAFGYEFKIRDIFKGDAKSDPFESFHNQLDSAYANAAKSTQQQSFVERAGDLAVRVRDCLVNAIDTVSRSPSLHNAVRVGLVTLAHHRV